MKKFHFVDVSGVGNSGKTTVTDLLREVDGVHSPPYWFEFDFIRMPNGLLDLRHRLLEDWSPLRSHYAIKAFCRTAEQMGVNPGRANIPSILKSTSQRYDRHFGGQFVSLSRAFALSFIGMTYIAEWPYDDREMWAGWRFLRKIGLKTGFRAQLRRKVLVADGTGFDERATAYLNQLYAARVAPECETVVLNNGLEPFNPIPGLDMIAGSKQIIVTRDPRDVYVSGLNRHNISQTDKALLPFDNDGLSKSFLATDNLSEFISRQRIFYNHVYSGDDPRVLKLRFEDMCLNYDETISRIFAFAGLDPVQHKQPRTCFIPEKSRSGVGIWRNYSCRDEVEYIARELPDLIYQA